MSEPRVAFVSPAKIESRWVFLPEDDLSMALCKLVRRPYLDIDHIKLITHPEVLGIRIAVLGMPGMDAIHWLTYPTRH